MPITKKRPITTTTPSDTTDTPPSPTTKKKRDSPPHPPLPPPPPPSKMPGPKMGARPYDFDELIVRKAPTFQKWLKLPPGETLRYACRDFTKGKMEDEERLMRRIMIARRNNLRDHEMLKRARRRSVEGGTTTEATRKPLVVVPAVAKSKTDGRKLMSDEQVMMEMDVEAVEATRSYKTWMQLRTGCVFIYNQKYVKGKEGHDFLLKKNIWRRMRYRRENKKMVESMKQKFPQDCDNLDETMDDGGGDDRQHDGVSQVESQGVGDGTGLLGRAQPPPEVLSDETVVDSANQAEAAAAVAAAASSALVNKAVVEAAVAAAATYVRSQNQMTQQQHSTHSSSPVPASIANPLVVNHVDDNNAPPQATTSDDQNPIMVETDVQIPSLMSVIKKAADDADDDDVGGDAGVGMDHSGRFAI